MPDTVGAHGRAHLRAVAAPRPRRILVVANHTATSPALIAALHGHANQAPVHVHLVVPALNTRLRHWVSDTDGAVSAAHRRAEDAIAVLRSQGLSATVEVGDSVPLLAIEDALAEFDADEIVISTLPPKQSHWLEHDLVALARSRFSVPVWHVIGTDGLVAAA